MCLLSERCGSTRLFVPPETWAPSQYPKRPLFVRSRKVSKPRDLYLDLSDRSEIWQALRQQCCRCACQISKRYDNLKYRSRGFETSRDLTKRRLFGYWDGALVLLSEQFHAEFVQCSNKGNIQALHCWPLLMKPLVRMDSPHREQVMRNAHPYQVIISLKTKNCDNTTFAITGGTLACHNDSLRCHQWRLSWHYHNFQFTSHVFPGLYLSDIPIHDSTRDLVLLSEQFRAEYEITQKLEIMNDKMQQTYRELEIEKQLTDKLVTSGPQTDKIRLD